LRPVTFYFYEYGFHNDAKDLIYEGIATSSIKGIFALLKHSDAKDLIYEGIATEVMTLLV